jgi:class 3 adenylate cyclase
VSEERRLVTVLFADVTGSTALGEHLDPEALRMLLSRFYGVAKDVVASHGGTLEKFIGDAVMAVFGLPVAHGDDAERALAAAIELRDRVRNDPKLSAQLPIRVGVNTGEVVATRDTSAGDFLVTGDAVSVAARLQQSADPWTVVCSERTARAAARAFEFGAAVEVQAKGKSQPLSAVPVQRRAQRSMPKRIPLVGRDADLEQLELVARRAFSERRPFLASLIAPPGIGKTRLLEEFLERLPSLAPHAATAISQCLPYGQRLTYWPLRQVLFRLVGIPDEATPDATRTAVAAWTADAGVEDAPRISEFLSATVGAGEIEMGDRDALFAAWRTLIETAARRRPLVLVFEDLHWSADSLLDLVEFVMQPRGDSPLLIIALTRPELLDRRPGWGGGRRNYVSLSLEPLPDEAVAQLIMHLMGQPSPRIQAQIVQRAEGNPFFAGEIVRSVMERIPSGADDDTIALALTQLPDTVQATVLARLDLLDPAERRILQLGAVLGRTFQPQGIGALAAQLVPDTAGALVRLVDKDLIRPADRDRYVFRHILIREVAYQTLPRAERGRLHAAAGRWLEDRAAGREDAFAELIAYHYREAATIGAGLSVEDTDREEVIRKAIAWLRRAAEAAMAGAALVEAARHLRSALELSDVELKGELYERLGDVGLSGAGSVEAYREALDIYRQLGRSADLQLRALAKLLTVHTRSQGAVAVRPSVQQMDLLRAEGRALLGQAADTEAKAMFLISEGFYPFWRAFGGGLTNEHIAEGEASAGEGLTLAEQLGNAKLRSMALDALAGCVQMRGGWREARQITYRRLEFIDQLDLIERLDTYSVIAWGSALLGELEEADRVSATALTGLQPGQAPTWALHAAAWRIYTLVLRGRWDAALSAAERAVQLWIEAGRISAGYAMRGFLAAIDVARARQDDATFERFKDVIEEITRAFEAAGRTEYSGRDRAYLAADVDALVAITDQTTPGFLGSERVERLLSLLADRRAAPGPAALRRIAEFANAGGLRVLEAQALRALGVGTGDVAALSQAVELFDQTDAVPYAARSRIERAGLTGDQDDLAAGTRVLETLGDFDYLSRVQRYVRRSG